MVFLLVLLFRHAIQKKIQLKKGDAEGASKKDRSEKKRKERKGSWERDSGDRCYFVSKCHVGYVKH